MTRNWTTIGGFLALVLGTGLLGGCGVNEKDFNAMKQENEDLRTKIATTETEKATLIARVNELEQTNRAAGDATGGQRDSTRTASTPRREKNVVLEVAGDVLFDPGQAVVKSSAKKQLDGIVSQLKGKYSGHNIEVQGHTDSDPIRKSKFASNEALSEARAQAVRDYLASKGIPGSKLSVVGYGASKPKGSKKDSRRVDIVVLAN